MDLGDHFGPALSFKRCGVSLTSQVAYSDSLGTLEGLLQRLSCIEDTIQGFLKLGNIELHRPHFQKLKINVTVGDPLVIRPHASTLRQSPLTSDSEYMPISIFSILLHRKENTKYKLLFENVRAFQTQQAKFEILRTSANAPDRLRLCRCKILINRLPRPHFMITLFSLQHNFFGINEKSTYPHQQHSNWLKMQSAEQ